jgi:hypothetical protein
MKKIILGSLLSLFACSSFAAYEFDDLYIFFMKSSDKKELLKNAINDDKHLRDIVGDKKCDKVTKFATITENGYALHLQVSCKNIKDDFHIFMTKTVDSSPPLSSCEEASKKFVPKAQCKGKLKQ